MEENMLTINNLTEEELKFFDEIQNQFPDKMMILKEHGFDSSCSVTVVLDLTEILKECIPYIVTLIEAILLYRIQKEQNEREKERVGIEKGKLELDKTVETGKLELDKERVAIEKEKIKNEKKNEIKDTIGLSVASHGETQCLLKDNVDSVMADPDKLPQFKADLRKNLEKLSKKDKKSKKAKK